MKRFCLLVLLSALGFPAYSTYAADSKKVDWETARNSSPETLEELKGLQVRVKEVAKKANESTVGLLVGQGAGVAAHVYLKVADTGGGAHHEVGIFLQGLGGGGRRECIPVELSGLEPSQSAYAA